MNRPTPSALRLRPSPRAVARGYLTFELAAPGAPPRLCRAPVVGTTNLIVSPRGKAFAVDAEDAAVAPLGAAAAILAAPRRLLPATRRARLDFDGLEIFPEGGKRETAAYRSVVKSARAARMAFDGAFARAHPELFLGWPAAPEGPSPSGPPRIAVALHLHYQELWPEIEALLARWRRPFALIVTLTRPGPAIAARARARFPHLDIRVVENSGRDVRPFLTLLEGGAFDGFDLVCKIHGKRSLREGYPPLLGEMIRRATFLDLVGSDEQVARILDRFADDARLGIVGPERFRASSRHGRPAEIMGASRAAIEALAMEMGGAPGPNYDVFHGTMFWVRPAALAPLRGLRLANRFAPEAGRSDGALEHAVEGLFNHAVRRAGYGVAGVGAEE